MAPCPVELSMAQRFVSDSLEKIFRRHGAVHVSVPQLMPKCLLYEASESYVCMIDRSGGLVALPHDSRVCPFFIAVYSHCCLVKLLNVMMGGLTIYSILIHLITEETG